MRRWGGWVLVVAAIVAYVYWQFREPSGPKSYSYDPTTDVLTFTVWDGSSWVDYRTVRRACEPGVWHLWDWDVSAICKEIALTRKEHIFLH